MTNSDLELKTGEFCSAQGMVRALGDLQGRHFHLAPAVRSSERPGLCPQGGSKLVEHPEPELQRSHCG